MHVKLFHCFPNYGCRSKLSTVEIKPVLAKARKSSSDKLVLKCCRQTDEQGFHVFVEHVCIPKEYNNCVCSLVNLSDCFPNYGCRSKLPTAEIEPWLQKHDKHAQTCLFMHAISKTNMEQTTSTCFYNNFNDHLLRSMCLLDFPEPAPIVWKAMKQLENQFKIRVVLVFIEHVAGNM